MEIGNIDMWGVMVQHKKEMIDKGSYVQVDIVVGRDDEIPFIQTKLQRYNSYMVAQLISIMEQRAKQLREEYPETEEILKFLTYKDIGTIKGGKDD